MSPKQTQCFPYTEVVQGGEAPDHPHDTLAPPLYQTATYTFGTTSEVVAFMEGGVQREEYGRYGNPTVRLVESKVAKLEGCVDAVAFSSGMAAVTTGIMALVRSGSHVVLFSDCYRRTRQFVCDFLVKFNVEHTVVPSADLAALEQALRPNTKLVISEAPTNPYQSVVDLPRLAELCREHRVKSMIDSTFATPINMRPAEYGIDLVVHSATKYLGGHNDVLGGVVAGASGLISLIRELRHVLGAVLDPHAAWLIHRGMKTLAVRVAQQNRTASALAAALQEHPRVKRVWYAGLDSHPDAAVARRLMTGFGGVVTFDVEGTLEEVGRFVDACRIPKIGPSLGGVDSLIEQPALMSYYDLGPEGRSVLGIGEGLVRYAVGLEGTEDVLRDVMHALNSTDYEPTGSEFSRAAGTDRDLA
ncbi:MAG: PLP-dependent aspartate aminotransferase family protein [Myxococcota bacterium]